jgi:hypothetical protein
MDIGAMGDSYSPTFHQKQLPFLAVSCTRYEHYSKKNKLYKSRYRTCVKSKSYRSRTIVY